MQARWLDILARAIEQNCLQAEDNKGGKKPFENSHQKDVASRILPSNECHMLVVK